MFKNGPLVSICVPIYNVVDYIERCAISLFEQTYPNIEYIFIDDCSPDNSVQILENLTLRYPSRKKRVRIIHHDVNKGLGEARNTAVRESKGEFVLHVDSDDYIDKDAVALLVQKQLETDADIVRFPYKIIGADNITTKIPPLVMKTEDWMSDILLMNTTSSIWGNFIRLSLYKNNCLKVECGVNQSEDFQVLVRLIYFSKSISYITNSFYYYDKSNEGSYTNNFNEKSLGQIIKTLGVLEDFFNKRNQKEYIKLLWKGQLKSLCRKKVLFAKNSNKKMYDLVSNTLRMIKEKYHIEIPLKYKILIFVRNYYLFSLLTFLKS